MNVTVDASEVMKNLENLPPRLEAALRMYGETAAKNLESQAKHNRPWTDRTSRARQGLTGSSDVENNSLVIVLAHTVDYGVWLELAHEKNWAIVEPTVRLESNKVIQGLQGLMEKIK